MRPIFSSQSVRKRSSDGGKAKGLLHQGWQRKAMPLMSPAKTPVESSFRSVLPPSRKKVPSASRLSGVQPK